MLNKPFIENCFKGDHDQIRDSLQKKLLTLNSEIAALRHQLLAHNWSQVRQICHRLYEECEPVTGSSFSLSLRQIAEDPKHPGVMEEYQTLRMQMQLFQKEVFHYLSQLKSN